MLARRPGSRVAAKPQHTPAHRRAGGALLTQLNTELTPDHAWHQDGRAVGGRGRNGGEA
jgi:hypothetical protein